MTTSFMGIFFRMYLQTFKNVIKSRCPPKVREWIILIFLGGYLALGYELFIFIFKYICTFPVIGQALVLQLWDYYFFILWIMLVISNAIVMSSTQYTVQETTFLFNLPIRASIIFFKQMLEGVVWSSWAFIFLSIPLMLSFGRAFNFSWHYYAGIIPFILLYVFSASLTGSLILFMLFKLSKTARRFAVFSVLMISVFVLLKFCFQFPYELRGDQDVQILSFLRNFLGGLSLSKSPFFPSHWFATALYQLALHNVTSASVHLGYLIGFVIILGGLGWWLSSNFYHSIWEMAQGSNSNSKKSRFSKFIQNTKLSSLVKKDILLFMRDPRQWGQMVLICSIMIFYISNLRNIRMYIDHPFWENIIFFLNLSSISLMIATLSFRFVFPQYSIEWRRNWIIGLLPIPFSKIIRTKFAYSFSIMFFLSQIMNLLSHLLLKSERISLIISIWSMTWICAGLVSLSLGLGILYPNPKSDDPSKILSGLGGIVTLMISMCYILVMLVPISIPFHLQSVGKISTSISYYAWIGSAMICQAAGSMVISISILRISNRNPWLE